jgi:hypothetical protein
MPLRRLYGPVYCALALVIGVSAGCIFSPEPDPPDPPEAPQILPHTLPENLVKNLITIYDDKVRTAVDRRQLYESLFPPDDVAPELAFQFKFQPADIALGLPPSWGKDAEIDAHEALFQAQESGEVYSLDLNIIYGPTEDLNETGREGWKQIFANNVQLRLMFNVEDGLEVNGGQAEFKFAPPVVGIWTLNEWVDLPRP